MMYISNSINIPYKREAIQRTANALLDLMPDQEKNELTAAYTAYVRMTSGLPKARTYNLLGPALRWSVLNDQDLIKLVLPFSTGENT